MSITTAMTFIWSSLRPLPRRRTAKTNARGTRAARSSHSTRENSSTIATSRGRMQGEGLRADVFLVGPRVHEGALSNVQGAPAFKLKVPWAQVLMHMCNRVVIGE